MNKFLSQPLALVLVFSLLMYGYPVQASPAEDAIKLDSDTRIEDLLLDSAGGDAYVDSVIRKVMSNPNGVKGHVIEVIHFGEETDPSLLKIMRRLHHAGIKVRGTVISEAEFESTIAGYSRAMNTDASMSAVLTRSDVRSWGRKTTDWIGSWFSTKEVEKRVEEVKDQIYGQDRWVTFMEHVYETEANGKLKRDEAGKRIRRFAEGAAGWAKTAAISTGIALTIFSSVMVMGGARPWNSLGQAGHFALCALILGAWIYNVIRFAPELTSFKSQWQMPFWDTSRPQGEQLVLDSAETNYRAAYLGLTIVQELIIVALLLPVIIGPANVNVAKATIGGVVTAFAHLFPEQLRATFMARSEKYKELNHEELSQRFAFLATAVTHLWFNLLFPIVKNTDMVLTDWVALIPLALCGVFGMGVEVYRNWTGITQSFNNFIHWMNPFRKKKNCRALLVHRETFDPALSGFAQLTEQVTGP